MSPGMLTACTILALVFYYLADVCENAFARLGMYILGTALLAPLTFYLILLAAPQ